MKQMPPLPPPESITMLLREIAPGSRLVDMRLMDGSFSNSTVLVTAVLDWEEASCGDPGYDVAYLRAELALLGGLALADQSLAAYEAEIGKPVANLPLWELATAVRFIENPAGMIPEWQPFGEILCTFESVNDNFSQFVANALREAGL